MDKKLLCGAAVRDITPAQDMFPMPRGIRGAFFGGVCDPLRVRAIALDDGETRSLLISFDLGGAPDPAGNIPKIAAHTGIAENNIFMFGTHAHAAPMVGRRGPMGAMEPDPNFIEISTRYEKLVYDAMYEAIDNAIKAMRPARYGYANGESHININRNQDYVTIDESGNRTVKCGLGFNPDGPIDRTLFTMRFEDYDGKPIAFFINYPVHCVVMHANDCFNGSMGISGDIAGLVSGYMEDMFPDSVAMWTSGSAGDINPIMMNNIYFPDPKTGAYKSDIVPGGDTSILTVLSTRHFADILRTLEKIDHVSGYAKLSTTVGWSYTPGRDVIMKDPSNFMSEAEVKITADTEPYDVRMQLLRLGDIALLGISGELYTTLSLHLKSISPLANTVIITHCASHMTRSGYIYDDDGIERDALHHNRSRILPGYVKDSLSKVMTDMFEQK